MKVWKSALCALLIGLSTTAARAEIRIGGLLETSGPLASLGQPTLEGALLAVEQVNAAGGIAGQKVTLVNLNTESDNTRTVSAMRRLLSQENVAAIIGPASSGSNFAIVEATERARVPLMANGASRGIVLPPEKRRYAFMAPLTDVVVLGVMLDDMQARGIRSLALLHSDVAFGTSGRDSLQQLVKERGFELAAVEVFGNADTDMTPQLTKIRGSGAQATVLWATGPGLAIATRNHRALGIQTPLYLTHAANDFNYLRLAGDAANGIRLPSSKIYVTEVLPDDDPQKPVLQRFVSEYQQKYGRMPATFAGNGYDSAMLLINAIKAAAKADPEAVRDALEQTNDYVGVTAVYSYGPQDHYGTRPESVRMLTVVDGAFALAD